MNEALPGLRIDTSRCYIELFHGRKDPEAQLDNWGSEGPIFGPFDWAHFVYRSHIEFCRDDKDSYLQGDLWIGTDDLIYYDGIYYGDISVVSGRVYATEDKRGILEARLVDYEKERSLQPGEK